MTVTPDLNMPPLQYALDFEDTSDIDMPFVDGRWFWADVDVAAAIAGWFGPGDVRGIVGEWWSRCRREDGSSDAMLDDLQAGGHVRKPCVVNVGGMEYLDGARRFGITDGCHRLAAAYLAGVASVPAAVGVYPDADMQFVRDLCVCVITNDDCDLAPAP